MKPHLTFYPLHYTSLARVVICIIMVTSFVSSRMTIAQITILGSFIASEADGLCGVGLDPETGNIWVHGCRATDVKSYSSAGDSLSSIPRPGEVSNDLDVAFTSVDFTFNNTAVSRGTLLFINGEIDFAEIYAVDKVTGSVIDTLKTSFGTSHVVGGAYNPIRNSFFLVQDKVPGPADENKIAEIDPVSGSVLNTFQITNIFLVNFGDLEVSALTGNLFVVSNVQSTIAEFTPAGELVELHALPAEVTSLTGIALDCAANEAWVAGATGTVWHLGQVPCAVPTGFAEELPPTFHLSSPYPNPFRSHTTFSIRMEQPQHVSVGVFDLLGRQVAALHEGELPAGLTHVFNFDGSGLASGIYLLRLEGEHFVETRRLLFYK